MLLETLIRDVRHIVNSIEVKYTKKAKANETVDSLRDADLYLNAFLGLDTFSGYNNFSVDSIIAAGMNFGEYDVFEMAANKHLIPNDKRDAVVAAYGKEIIANYVEKNNYYRALNGLPNLEEDESEFFKLTTDEMIEYGVTVDSNLYLHQYSDDIIYSLQNAGYIDKLIDRYPEKKYLKYLGFNKIPIDVARQANNFSILSISKDVPEEFYSMFTTVYEQNREYFMTTIYIQDYSSQYDLYDNFIALCIMIMTIQRMVSNTFKLGIQREFYDWEFIQNMYKMYNIPFVDDLPIEHHITLLKNLNNLLRYKSTDKVLFDICSLLGYERMKIFKYYLVKEHKLDDNEEPIFKYIEVEDDNGNKTYVEDVKNMYDLYFQSVNINERNMALAMSDVTNRLDYDEVISNDPYWWEDADLEMAKYDNEYNYIETKYISLNLMYKMTEMLFEITYAFRMILDKKDEIDKLDIKIELPKLSTDKSFNLFDVVIFLTALICKQNGFAGNVMNESQASHIYGFNFDEDQLVIIRKFIDDNANVFEKDPLNPNKPLILKYFTNLELASSQHVTDLYASIREYNDYIVNKMYESKDINEYRIYKKLFDISMVTKAYDDMFMYTIINDDGEVTQKATTYKEYLSHSDPVLYDILETLDKGEINNALEHILFKINELVTSLQYLYIVNDTMNPLFTSIVKLLRFFKSYTTDLTSFNVIYVFDSKHYNAIKMIDDIHYINKEFQMNESMNQLYSDTIKTISARHTFDDTVLKFVESYKKYITIYLSDKYESINNYDYLHTILVNSIADDVLNIKDNAVIQKLIAENEDWTILDTVLISLYNLYKDNIIYSDEFNNVATHILSDNNNIGLYEKINSKSQLILFLNKLIKEDYIIHGNISHKEMIKYLTESYTKETLIVIMELYKKFKADDSIEYISANNIINTRLYIEDSVFDIMLNLILNDDLNLIEDYLILKNIVSKDILDLSYSDNISQNSININSIESGKLNDKLLIIRDK